MLCASPYSEGVRHTSQTHLAYSAGNVSFIYSFIHGSEIVCCAGFTEPQALNDVDLSEEPQPQGFAAVLRSAQRLFQRVQGDPFYAVISYRNYKPVD